MQVKRFELGKEGLPDLPLMMLITLDALRALGGSATIQEILDHVIEQEGVSEEDQSWLMPNERDRRLNYYLSWARTYLKRGDALENSARGVWALTERGENIYSLEETQAIYNQVAGEERQRTKAKRDYERTTSEQASNGANEKRSALAEKNGDEGEASWQDILLSELMKIHPSAFERLAQRLLREAGFVKVEVCGKTGDGGLDGFGTLWVNLLSFKVYFQCKRWKNSVGASDIRDFRGALDGRTGKGLFITTSSFTKQAYDEAARDGTIPVDLIDGQRLCELLKEYGLGVKTETVERVTIESDWLRDL